MGRPKKNPEPAKEQQPAPPQEVRQEPAELQPISEEDLNQAISGLFSPFAKQDYPNYVTQPAQEEQPTASEPEDVPRPPSEVLVGGFSLEQRRSLAELLAQKHKDRFSLRTFVPALIVSVIASVIVFIMILVLAGGAA